MAAERFIIRLCLVFLLILSTFTIAIAEIIRLGLILVYRQFELERGLWTAHVNQCEGFKIEPVGDLHSPKR